MLGTSVRRRLALATVVAVVVAGLGLVTSPSGATAAFNAYGSVRCTMSGAQTSKPGLTGSATAGVVQVVKAKLTCTTGSTGNANVTVNSGRLVATSAAATLSCSTAALPRVTASIKWTARGGNVNPTYVLWSGGSGSTSPRVAKTYPTSVSLISGSYAGGTAALHFVHDALGVAACATRAGMKKVTFKESGGASTFEIPSSPPTLLFSDEFTGTALDGTKWRPNWVGTTDAAISKPVNTAEQGCYDPSQVSVSGGYLRLNAVARACRATNGVTYPYASGLVQTKDHFTFTYGRVEARIWMPPGAGSIQNWPAFWTDGTGLHPKTGELDVVEGIAGRACFHFHSSLGEPGGCATAANPAGWHTYAADWRAGVVTYFYDGVQVGRITQGITGAPMFVVLNLGLSSTVSGPVALPSQMLVDYVRVSA
jgi:beta-glucanase (GH16 family)